MLPYIQINISTNTVMNKKKKLNWKNMARAYSQAMRKGNEETALSIRQQIIGMVNDVIGDVRILHDIVASGFDAEVTHAALRKLRACM
jgi:hypothetical protein